MATINYRILKTIRKEQGRWNICGRFIQQVDPLTKVVFTEGKRFNREAKITHNYMGNVDYKKKGGIRPDVPKWFIIQEPEGVFMYKPQLLEDCCFDGEQLWSRGTRAYEVTGWSDRDILFNCDKDGRLNGSDYKDLYDTELRTKRYITTTEIQGVFWCIEYDGKSIFDVMEDHPKMPVGQIKEVIINEGGIIETDGTIRRGNR